MPRPLASVAPLSRTAVPPKRLPAILALRDLRDEMHSSSSPSPILVPQRDPCTLGNVDSRSQQSRQAIYSTPEQEGCRSQAEGGLRLLFDLRYRYSYRTI